MAFLKKSRRQTPGHDRDDLFAMLERDHRSMRALLEQVLDTIDTDPEGARLLVAEASIQLLAHARAEERTLYVALQQHDESRAIANEGHEEHAVIEMLLDQLAASRVVDDTYKAKVKVLTEILDHHIEEEEEEMFPKARDVLGEARRSSIATTFGAEKHAELGRLAEAAADQAGAAVILGAD